MGLAHLLSVSQSFRVAADQPHRFRTARHGGVPRFDASAGLNREVPMKTENNAVVEPRVGADEAAAPKARNEADAESHATSSQRPVGRMVKTVSVLRAWFSWERWGLKKRSGVPASGRPARKVVQQELRLEHVKVCRNDLTDADWELAQPPKSGARLAFLRNLASTGASVSPRNRTVSREAGVVRS